MSILSKPFYDVMRTHEPLTQSLDIFNNRPAIFTYEPIPEPVVGPYIITSGDVADVPEDTKDTTGRRITRDIRLYAPASGTAEVIEGLAEIIRTLFHRVDLTVTGHKCIYTNVTGPIEVDEVLEALVYARILTVEVFLVTV